MYKRQTESPVFYVFNSCDWLGAWISPELSLIQLRHYSGKRRAASSQLYDSKQTSYIVMNISVSLKSMFYLYQSKQKVPVLIYPRDVSSNSTELETN